MAGWTCIDALYKKRRRICILDHFQAMPEVPIGRYVFGSYAALAAEMFDGLADRVADCSLIQFSALTHHLVNDDVPKLDGDALNVQIVDFKGSGKERLQRVHRRNFKLTPVLLENSDPH